MNKAGECMKFWRMIFAFSLVIAAVLGCGGGTYMPLHLHVNIQVIKSDLTPIEGLQCTLVKSATTEHLTKVLTDNDGMAHLEIINDEVKSGIQGALIFGEYSIYIQDIDGDENNGNFSDFVYQPQVIGDPPSYIESLDTQTVVMSLKP